MLELMLENYGERPVGLTTIAALTGDEAATIEDYYEPYASAWSHRAHSACTFRHKKAQEHLTKVRQSFA